MVAETSALIMQMPIGTEWVMIVVVIIVAFFGVKKIPELARSFGKATGEYQKAKLEAGREIQLLKNQGSDARSKLEEVAGTLGINSDNKTDAELRSAIDAELKRTRL